MMQATTNDLKSIAIENQNSYILIILLFRFNSVFIVPHKKSRHEQIAKTIFHLFEWVFMFIRVSILDVIL